MADAPDSKITRLNFNQRFSPGLISRNPLRINVLSLRAQSAWQSHPFFIFNGSRHTLVILFHTSIFVVISLLSTICTYSF